MEYKEHPHEHFKHASFHFSLLQNTRLFITL